MVATSSAATQASENEKRRKQTMEKVKANHLSRQLQMRLQYARLKVEHGWQKQNLNEVENLYFHNSHLRGSKPFPVPTIATTQQQHSSFSGPLTSAVQSSLSFKLAPSSLGRIALNSGQVPAIDRSISTTPPFREGNNLDQNPQTIQVTPPPPQDPLANIDPLLRLDLPTDTSAMVVDPQERLNPSVATISDPVVLNMPTEDVNITQKEPSVLTTSLSPPQESVESPIDSQSSSSNHYTSAKISRPRIPKAPAVPKPPPSLTARDMYNFGSASTLTYDSFWSSHSGSTTPRPGPSRGPAPGEFAPTFQIPGDFTSGIPELGRPTSNPIHMSSPSLTPPQ
ncbi:hypothetical protein CVT25_005171 [Psilocybe cyanescens]|uniref:Uncharacterized protein n=1 Tax=Psilocybe cyanescens TaxID=93625 RepID=A0A409XBS9_PSICY|nr:hypothetical protein CVT25_005171 [Psilocybe cyanescens]